MAYSLKSTGLATHVVNMIMVDDDDTTVVDIGSSPATLVVDANVTIENLDWNGVTRKAFETKANGSFNFYGITFSANAPALPHGSGSGGNTQVAIYARATANGGLGYAFSTGGTGAIGMGLDSTGYDNPGAIRQTSFLYGSSDSYTATDFSERVILAVTHEYGAVRQVFADTDGGTSTALDVDTTDAGFGSNGELVSIGGYAGQGHVRMRVLAYINFDNQLTLSELQSLRDDWFGVLIDASGVDGTGSVAAQDATASGTAERELPSSGTPAAQASSVAGTAERVLLCSGELLSGASSVSGTAALQVKLLLTAAVNRELRDENGSPVANLAGIIFEWYDKDTDTDGTPDVSGTFSTNASGEATVQLAGSSLVSGQYGLLVLEHPSDNTIRGIYRIPVS